MEQNSELPQSPNSQNPVSQSIKPNSFLISLLSFLLLLSCIVAGFFAWQTQNLVKELQGIRNQNSVTPTPTTTTDPTTDWKTYVNTKYKFEIKRPKEVLVGYFNTRSGLFSDPVGKEDQIDILLESQNDLFKKFIQIEITDATAYKKKLYVAVNDIYNEQKEHFQTTKISQLSQIKYLGFDGYEYSFSGQAMRTLNWGGVIEVGDYKVKIFEKEGYYFAFYSRTDKTLDQILSTFKFIEPQASPSPIACTIEAKICPDGTSVGRVGPKCEFAPCPTPKP